MSYGITYIEIKELLPPLSTDKETWSILGTHSIGTTCHPMAINTGNTDQLNSSFSWSSWKDTHSQTDSYWIWHMNHSGMYWPWKSESAKVCQKPLLCVWLFLLSFSFGFESASQLGYSELEWPQWKWYFIQPVFSSMGCLNIN